MEKTVVMSHNKSAECKSSLKSKHNSVQNNVVKSKAQHQSVEGGGMKVRSSQFTPVNVLRHCAPQVTTSNTVSLAATVQKVLLGVLKHFPCVRAAQQRAELLERMSLFFFPWWMCRMNV